MEAVEVEDLVDITDNTKAELQGGEGAHSVRGAEDHHLRGHNWHYDRQAAPCTPQHLEPSSSRGMQR